MPETILQLTRPSNQLIGSGTDTPISWTHQTIALSWITLTLPSSLIKVPADGLYLVTASIWWDTNTTGIRQVILIGGTATARPVRNMPPSNVLNGVPEECTGSLWITAASGLTISVFQSSGGNRNLIGATIDRAPTLTIRQIATGTPI